MSTTIGRRLPKDEAGLTAVELLVVMVLMGIIGAFVTPSLIGGMRTTAYGQDRVEAMTNAQVGIERLSRELRAADPLRIAEPSRAAAVVYRGGALHYYVYEAVGPAGDREVIERRRTFTDPDVYNALGFNPATATPDQTTERVLVRDIRDDDVFTYLNRDGDIMPFPVADAGTVWQAQVTLVRNVDSGRSPVRVETLVKIRNS